MQVERKLFQLLTNQQFKETKMKKLLALLIVAVFASTAMAADKKPAPAKKEVKHHKKAEGTKVEGTKPDTAAPKKKK